MRFTVRRPATTEVSPCCHRPSGGDVACGVDVSIAGPGTAGGALENRLALAVFGRDVPALGASLRRIRCGDDVNPPGGLVLQSGHQQSPPLATDLAVDAAFLRDAGTRVFTGAAPRAGHRAHLQVFDADGVEAAGQIGGGFFYPIAAAICFAGAHLRDVQLGSCAPGGSALRPGQAPLQSAEPFGFARAKAWSAQQLPAGQGNRDRHAAVHTNDAAVAGSCDSVGDGSESDVPTPRPIEGDSVGLHGVGDGARPAELHPTELGYPDLSIAAVQPGEVARFDSDLPESLMLAGLTSGRATVRGVKKVAHRLGEVPQRLLLHRLRPGCQPVVFRASRRQLGTLLVIPGRLAAWLPVPLLLDGKIPHKPGMTTVFDLHRRLLRAGKQPKPAHANNLGSTTDNQSKGRRRPVRSRLRPGVSTPRNL